jgi:hypothetical protein
MSWEKFGKVIQFLNIGKALKFWLEYIHKIRKSKVQWKKIIWKKISDPNKISRLNLQEIQPINRKSLDSWEESFREIFVNIRQCVCVGWRYRCRYWNLREWAIGNDFLWEDSVWEYLPLTFSSALLPNGLSWQIVVTETPLVVLAFSYFQYFFLLTHVSSITKIIWD